MKKIIFLIATTLLCFACQEKVVDFNPYNAYDSDLSLVGDGKPQIENIYLVPDTTTPVMTAQLQDAIMLEGVNLINPTKVFINDVEVPLNSIYAKSHNSYIIVPRKAPIQVDNKLTYTTAKGTKVVENFIITKPDLKVDGLLNEFQKPGRAVQVLGDFFDMYNFGVEGSTSTITINGEACAIDSCSDKYTSIIIPADAPDNSEVVFGYVDNDGNWCEKKVPYRPTGTFIVDPKDHDSWFGWWPGDTEKWFTDGTKEGDPESPYGYFLHLNCTLVKWAWTQIFGAGGNVCTDASQHPEDYNFVFEVWSDASTPFLIAKLEDNGAYNGGYRFQFNGYADGNGYHFNPSANGSFNTYGEWQTYRIPLNEFVPTGVADGWNNITFILQPSGASEWVINHAFANFRVQHK